MCTVLGGTGGDSLFFTQITYPKMPRTGSNGENTKHSNVLSTSTGTKTVSRKDFISEMNAKNRAYLFIMSQGLFTEFAEFCKKCSYSDPHAAGIDLLARNL